MTSTLSTYWSDKNASTKTPERVLSEIDTVKPYTPMVILFREGDDVNAFKGLGVTDNSTDESTTDSTALP
ncbi:MAG: hypothetical protein ACP5OJ_06840 [Methanothermobacter sp.]